MILVLWVNAALLGLVIVLYVVLGVLRMIIDRDSPHAHQYRQRKRLG